MLHCLTADRENGRPCAKASCPDVPDLFVAIILWRSVPSLLLCRRGRRLVGRGAQGTRDVQGVSPKLATRAPAGVPCQNFPMPPSTKETPPTRRTVNNHYSESPHFAQAFFHQDLTLVPPYCLLSVLHFPHLPSHPKLSSIRAPLLQSRPNSLLPRQLANPFPHHTYLSHPLLPASSQRRRRSVGYKSQCDALLSIAFSLLSLNRRWRYVVHRSSATP